MRTVALRRSHVGARNWPSCTRVPTKIALQQQRTSQFLTLNRWVARAGGSDFEAAPASITTEEACKILGVDPSTPFENVMEVKNRLLQSAGSNTQRKKEIDAAYDALLFASMKRRLSGEATVASVRFADVPKPRPAKKADPPNPLLKALPKVQMSRQSDITTQAAVFGSLATWALIQALLETPESAASDVAGWQLALAAAFAVYSFKENKRLSLGRSIGLTAAALLLGSIVGGGLESWLRVDIVPIGGFSSPGVLVAEFALFGLWAACTLLV